MARAYRQVPFRLTGPRSQRRLATIGPRAHKEETDMRIAIASDHAGFDLKELLLNRLAAEPDLVLVDLGTKAATPPVDYPDYARAAAEAVVRGEVDRAIMVCGSGAGACMAADKVRG